MPGPPIGPPRLTSSEIIGTSARLGIARLGATRLGATPPTELLRPGTGLYAYQWVDTRVWDGDPPGSVEAGWTVGRTQAP